MISITNLSKKFGLKPVLHNLNLTIEHGSRVALLGLSGSGKTTALKLICGLHLPDSGSVVIDGIPLEKKNLSTIRKRIGYVIQDGGLFPHLTARENILLIAEEANLSPEETQKRIEELALMTKIPLDLLKRYPRQLSGGQRQRVGIMRALFLDPDILLLDEPMGALDPITRVDLQAELRELFITLNKTVVLVTHDLYEATYLAERIVLLSEGKIIQEGTMSDLIKRPASEFVSTFVNAQKHHMGEV